MYDEVYLCSGVVSSCETAYNHRWVVLPKKMAEGKESWAWNK
jgi:hypothetical protein